jgi:glyoxylase-like metal-dependent hydrolase (beta-lactamase superfamily II)
MKRKSILIVIALFILIILSILGFFIYPQFKSFMNVDTVLYDKELTFYLGGGGNSGVLVTDSAVVVIDTKMSKPAIKLYDLAKEKAGSKPIIVINTHYHGDHVKGNRFYKAGKIYIGAYDKDFLAKNIDAENQPNSFVKDSLLLNLGNESLLLVNLGQAHTYDDMVVYLVKHRILFTGDLVQNKMNPYLKKESGADVNKWIMALDRINKGFDMVTIVPGHGKIGGKELSISMYQYFTDMNKAASDLAQEKDLIKKYSAWTNIPGMSSPETTIKYIKGK